MCSSTVKQASRRFVICGLVGVLTTLALAGPASASIYPNKPEWIEEASEYILTHCPNIDAFMWFQANKERDWRVNSSPASLTAYQNSWGGLDQGVYLEPFPAVSLDTTPIDDFETLVGAHQTRIGWYESLSSPFPTAAVELVQDRGSVPFIVWEPFDASLGDTARTGPSRLQSIVDGDYDDVLSQWATAAQSTLEDVEIVFGHEMNGNWFTWGYLMENGDKPADENTPGHNGNTAQLYIDAFQYVADYFEHEGVDNVDFVWSINASWHDDFSMAWPGEEYVDRMGMNGFNWGDDPNGPSPDYLKWRDAENIFGAWDPNNPDGVNNYEALVALAPDLPIIIGEFASAPEPGMIMLLALGGLALMHPARTRRRVR